MIVVRQQVAAPIVEADLSARAGAVVKAFRQGSGKSPRGADLAVGGLLLGSDGQTKERDELVILAEISADGTELNFLNHTEAMLANSPQAMALSKQAVWGGLEQGYGQALERAWGLLRSHWTHPDFLEGPRAFGEGRAPEWDPDPEAQIEDDE